MKARKMNSSVYIKLAFVFLVLVIAAACQTAAMTVSVSNPLPTSSPKSSVSREPFTSVINNQKTNNAMNPPKASVSTKSNTHNNLSTTIELLAVGDIMMHSTQFPAYFNHTTKRYQFESFFTNVKEQIQQADLAWANLETPLLGGEKRYKGYPLFNAPPELADALELTGFDIVTTANNHALDRREAGVIKTLEVLKARGLITKGTYISKSESEQPTIINKKGVKLGILAYTYGTNGIPLPKKKPYMVDLMDENKMIQDISMTKKAGADVIIVALHFGNEYEKNPSKAQVKLARKLVQSGADVIIGSHPHVLQPYELVKVKNTDGHVRQALIMYSLGNFISGQEGETRNIGVMFRFKLTKNSDGIISIHSIKPEPTWVSVSRGKRYLRYQVMSLQQLSSSNHPKKGVYSRMLKRTMKHLQKRKAIPILQAID